MTIILYSYKSMCILTNINHNISIKHIVMVLTQMKSKVYFAIHNLKAFPRQAVARWPLITDNFPQTSSTQESYRIRT